MSRQFGNVLLAYAGALPDHAELMLLHGAKTEPIPQVVSGLLFAHPFKTCGFTVEHRKHPGTADQATLDNERYLLSWLDDRVAGSAPPTTPSPSS